VPTSPTKTGTLRLSDIAKHVVAPAAITSTGWPPVCGKCAELGIRFRPWQPDVGRLILAKRADGLYAATIGGTGLSIPRQVGKTFLVAAIIFALCLLRPGLTVIWTAHRLRTAEETFGKLQVFAKRSKIKPHVEKVVLGSGEEEIRFRNGSRILFGARERGFGRGFDEVDVLVYDEAQILGESALDDMVPATNQSRQPTGALLLFMGTPPKPEDKSEVFERMRSEALSGDDSDTGWVEFGADDNFTPTPLPQQFTKADWAQVAKANPSYPHDTTREAILRMRKQLGPESMLREGFGVWDEDRLQAAIPMDRWQAIAETARQPPRPVGPVSVSVEVDFDRAWSAVSVAGGRPDGVPQVQVVMHHGGTAWAVDEIAGIVKRHRVCAVPVDPNSPAGSLIAGLEDAGVEVTKMTTGDAKQACGQFHDGAVNGTFRHLAQPELDVALKTAQRRIVGDGWLWDRKANGDITPLVSATNALWGWTTRHGSGDLQIF